jgi:uncharacterized metal-binding protein YceD (DUF177 family)
MAQRPRQPKTSSQPQRPPPAESPWKFPVAVAEVPETGRHVDFTAAEQTRAAIAKLADLVDLPRLEASFDLTRQGHDGLRVSGRVVATVVQNCVVTLEPVESALDETIDLTFVPPGEAAGSAKPAAYQPIDGEEPPEVLHDGVVDLGAVATEFLLLGIDPYPRKDGVAFDAPVDRDPAGHAFAALAALKKGGNPKDR